MSRPVLLASGHCGSGAYCQKERVHFNWQGQPLAACSRTHTQTSKLCHLQLVILLALDLQLLIDFRSWQQMRLSREVVGGVQAGIVQL